MGLAVAVAIALPAWTWTPIRCAWAQCVALTHSAWTRWDALGTLPGLPRPGPRLRVALGRVSGGGPRLSSWERRPQGLVVELLCVQNGAGVRGIRHQDRALGEAGWGRLGGRCVCGGVKAPKARPEPAEAACRVPPSRLA